MKKILIPLALLFFILNVRAQNVGIGTKTPAASAQLDVSSTTKGLLPPRMTYAQRNLIVNPVVGLVVYCTDCDELQIYNGVIWKNMYGTVAAPPSGYPTVTICSQVWMGKNLAVSNYRNGDVIPQVTEPSIWGSITVGAWCWYNNDSITYSHYGKLYNWYAVNDARGLAPEGWHIPTNLEWATLTTCLGGEAKAGAAMKESDTTHWASPNTLATNSSGFTGLPGGRNNTIGMFSQIKFYSWNWSSTANGSGFAVCYYLFYNDGVFSYDTFSARAGLSVRCLRN